MNCMSCFPGTVQRLEDTDEEYGKFPEIPITYDNLKKELRCGLSAEARLYWWPILPTIQHNADLLTPPPNVNETAMKRYSWAKERIHAANISTTSSPGPSPSSIRVTDGGDDSCSSTPQPQVGDVSLATTATTTTTTTTHSQNHIPDRDDRINEVLSLLIHIYDLKEPGLIQTYVNLLVLMIPNVAVCFQTCCTTLDRSDWFLSSTAASHRLKLYTFKELVRKYLPNEYTRLQGIGALNSEYLNLLFIDLFFTLMPTPDVMRIMDCFLLEGTKIIHRFGLGILYFNRDLLQGEGIGTGQIFWEAIRSRCHTRLNFNDLAHYAFTLKGNRFLSMFSRGLKRQTMELIEGQGRSSLGTDVSAPLNLGYITSQGILNSFDPASKILDSTTATHLKSALPLIMEHEKFALVFSTHRDGWNLDTLFKRTVHMSPCIILIKSLQQNGVVGAFIPVPISPPTDSVRGNGTAFVFRLTHDKCDVYKWSDRDPSSSSSSSSAYSHAHESSTSVQFAMFTSEYILIGGSAVHGTNAIRIDSELKTCSCGPSDTYHNPPLLPEELIQPFIIGELEIFCPISSHEKEKKSQEYTTRSLWKSESFKINNR